VALARKLVPYLADAVPGWFQATMALYDADAGKWPTPMTTDSSRSVLYYRIPKDGSYELRDP